eukprot:823493-Rhodomonas_salina.2
MVCADEVGSQALDKAMRVEGPNAIEVELVSTRRLRQANGHVYSRALCDERGKYASRVRGEPSVM